MTAAKSPRLVIKLKPKSKNPNVKRSGGCTSSGGGGGITKVEFITKEKPDGKKPPISKGAKKRSS
jgi:hypothetical protein